MGSRAPKNVPFNVAAFSAIKEKSKAYAEAGATEKRLIARRKRMRRRRIADYF
jgi:hypothetical protein